MGRPFSVLRVDGASGTASQEFAKWASSRKITVIPSPPHAHWTLGIAESRMPTLKVLAETCFGASGYGVEDALASQSNLDILAFYANSTVTRGTNTTPFLVFYGHHAPTALADAAGTISPPEFSLDSWITRFSAIQTLAQGYSSVTQLHESASRTPGDLSVVYKPQQLVLVWHPSTHKFQPDYRGPYIVKEVKNADWVNVIRLVDRNNADAKPMLVHRTRLRPFNASRTSESKLLTHGLDPSFGVVTDILSHAAAADGTVLFTVKWSDDSISSVPGSWLTKLDIYAKYLASHDVAGAPPASGAGKKKK